MIVYETKLKEIPATCLDCTCNWCYLPLKQNKYEPTVRKEYKSKRHKDCPLKIIGEEQERPY